MDDGHLIIVPDDTDAQSHSDPDHAVRPWGRWDRLIKNGRFQVKQIMVNPGQRLSLQSHHHRAEHWVVVSGTARVTCDDRQ